MALGAVRAFEECGRENQCCVVGQNARLDAREELRHRHSSLIDPLAYFPEPYGDEIIRLGAVILSGHSLQTAVFTRHQLVTRDNIDRMYPLDGVLPDCVAVAINEASHNARRCVWANPILTFAAKCEIVPRRPSGHRGEFLWCSEKLRSFEGI